jgi:hypothetical protein
MLFLTCIALLGSFVAGAHYYTVDLPQQQSVQTPENYCIYTYGQCKESYYSYRTVTMCCWKDCCTTPADLDITYS